MADKLIFPIGFDLESGLQTAKNDVGRVARQLEDVIKKTAIKVPVGLDEATAKKLREEAKDIERVLANIKNNYGSGQLKGLSIGFINTQKEIEGIKRLEIQLQTLRDQRTSLVNGGATIEELRRIDAEIQRTEIRLKMMYQAFNKDQSSNVAISQQIVKLKQLAEELAGIDRMYARMQASAAAANKPVNSYEVNEMLTRRREIMEEITRVTKTATEAQKELFNIKGVGVGASQGIFGVGGEQALSAITQQISRYEELKNKLREVEGEYERLKAMQAQGMGDQSAAINQTLQRRIAIQKELGEITQTAAQAQKELEKRAQATAAAFQRGRGAIENFNRVMKLPENRIMNIQQKINLLNQALKRVSIGSDSFNKIVGELTRLSKLLDEAKAKQEALTGAQKKTGEAGKRSFREQTSYLNILIKRLAVYTSLDAVMGFLTKVREVTAQFELQRISLGAIINDQLRANQLFNEIKQFALKSPVKILDLTKYTKQLAAFRFETDTLFDTTKRVADIAVGLSVPMDRLILALGHVKASTYLTGITLRQFSMAGIPMLELLAERYSKLEGQAVSTTDVLKRVHDKMVSFEDVNQIFIELTSSGGMFYNMQEKQGNTLYGMWAKLGDAASVMYDEIGNTESVNSAMKGIIQLLTDMMRNWQSVARRMGAVGVAILGLIVRNKILALEVTKVSAIQQSYNIQMMRANALASSNSRLVRMQGMALGFYAKSMRTASTAAAAFGTSLSGIRAALVATGWGALAVALGFIVDKLLFAKNAAEKASEAIDKIYSETATEQGKSVRNFEHLAEVAVNAADGSRKQTEALEELQRTYKNILPQEVLELDYLKQLKGDYDSLTQSIREYVAEQQRRKAVDEVANAYGVEKLKYERSATKIFEAEGWSAQEIARFWEKFYDAAKDPSKSLKDVVRESLVFAGRDAEKDFKTIFRKLPENGGFGGRGGTLAKWFKNNIGGSVWNVDDVDMLRDAVLKENKALEQTEERMKASASASSAFAEAQEKSAEKVKNAILTMNGKSVDRDSFLGQQMLKNLQIQELTNNLKQGFEKAGLQWNESFGNFIECINASKPELISSLNFDAIIESISGALNNPKLTDTQRKFLTDLLSFARRSKAAYDDLVPSDPVVRTYQARFIQIAQAAGGFQKEYNRHLMNAGESLKDYNKRLKDSLEGLKDKVKSLLATQALIAKAGVFAKALFGVSAEDLQDQIDKANKEIQVIEKMLSGQPDFDKNKSKSGSKSDPRLNNLKEEISLTKKLYDEYKKLEKQIGATKAAEKIQEIYSNTIKTLQGRAKKYGFTFQLPFTDENLKANMQQFINKMKELQKLTDKKGKPLFPNIGKDIDEAVAQLEDVDFNSLQKTLEKKLKDLSDKISRTKTAKEFYDKILSQTGDVELAGNLTMSIYGSEDGNIQELLAQQIREYFGEYEVEIPVIAGTDKIDYKRVRELAKAAYDAKNIGKDAYDALDKIATDGEKDLAKIAEQGTKLLLKFDEIAQQRVNIEQEASEKIRQLREAEAIFLASNASEQEKAAYKKRTDKAVAGVEADRDLGLLKLKDEYLRFFSAIHSLTNKEAETLRTQVRQALFKAFQSGAIGANQLKKELKAVDEQFRKLKDDSGMAMDYLKGGFDGLIQRVRDTADELQSVAAEISKMESPDQISEGQKSFIDKILGKFGNENTGKSFADLFSKAKGDTGQMAKNLQGCSEGMEGMADNASQALAIVDLIIKSVDATIRGIAQIRDQLNEMRSEDNKLKGGFWDAFEYLENFNKYAASGWEKLKSGDVIGAATDTISSIISLFGTANSQKVRKLNEEIKRQGDIIEDLQYTYSRLEKTADKLFGKDYIDNYNQQLRNLQAQAEAYRKQYEAEQSKGKGADEGKLKQYKEAWRETMDEIADMQSELVEKFTGSSKPDVARQMAQSWIDAKASMSNTFAAIQGDYKDMIKNMIVEGAAARVIENALTPMWNKMDAMLKDNNIDAAIDALVGGMDSALNAANNGMEVLWKALEARGYDMKQLIGDVDENYTGIKRDIAGASEETMSNVATIGNTLMYYVSPIPGIAANVALLTQHIVNGNASAVPTANAGVDFAAYHTESLQHLNTLTVRTSEILAQCKELNSQTKSIADALGRVVIYKGNSHGIKVYM